MKFTPALLLLTTIYLLLPFFISFLVRRFDIFRKTGTIFLAYIIGLILGNTGLIPDTLYDAQETISGVAVLLAIPMLLFTVKIPQLIKTTGNVLKCFTGGLLAVIITVTTGYLFWGAEKAEMWKTSGMLVGVYTGGTPNLASIQTALEVEPAHFVLLNTYDMLLSSIYLLFLFTVGKKWFIRLLGKTEKTKICDQKIDISRNNGFVALLKPVLFSAVILAVGLGSSYWFFNDVDMLYVILVLTTISLGISFIPSVNNNEKAYDAGMYFILVFSLAVASMADVTQFSEVAPFLLRYLSWVVFGSLLLHLAWCKLLKLRGDLMMVTSVALICSPPFVPVIAGQINNRNLIVGGLTVGLIGYAIGNYLGITIALLLKG